MTADEMLVARARNGDEAAFADLAAPRRRELHVHCYRMLGSFDDAEDAVQDTLVAAWRGFGSFEGNASVRTWLYRIATNTCLNRVRSNSRRPLMTDNLPPTTPPPTGSEPVTWIQPYPDQLLDEIASLDPGPDAVIERDDAVSLAFITALQLLTPRARAVLIMRDVLGFSAHEVGAIVDSTPEAIAMTLSRARAAVAAGTSTTPKRHDPTTRTDHQVARLLADAFRIHDIDTVVSLLAEDVRVAMPPLPAVWQGRQRAAEFITEVAFRLVPKARFVLTHANRQPALATYSRDDVNGVWHASGLLVLTLTNGEITALTRFEAHILRSFGLPTTLTDDGETDH